MEEGPTWGGRLDHLLSPGIVVYSGTSQFLSPILGLGQKVLIFYIFFLFLVVFSVYFVVYSFEVVSDCV